MLLDKPPGLSSNQALQRVRRRLLAAKGGHAGTLDPMATGMLPLCFGHATKACGQLLGSSKCYRATVRLGSATDTGDAEGSVIREAAVPALDRPAGRGRARRLRRRTRSGAPDVLGAQAGRQAALRTGAGGHRGRSRGPPHPHRASCNCSRSAAGDARIRGRLLEGHLRAGAGRGDRGRARHLRASGRAAAALGRTFRGRGHGFAGRGRAPAGEGSPMPGVLPGSADGPGVSRAVPGSNSTLPRRCICARGASCVAPAGTAESAGTAAYGPDGGFLGLVAVGCGSARSGSSACS